MRNSALHATLEAFAAEAASRLRAATKNGAELAFELVQSELRRPGCTPLYCYRPLTGEFIGRQLGMLRALPSWTAAVRALAALDGVQRYVRARGQSLIPADGHERAELALQCFLARVFEERSEFFLDRARFAAAYGELESALYQGRSVLTVLTALLGVALGPGIRELALGGGLSLIDGRMMPDAPREAVYGSLDEERPSEEPNVLAVLTIADDPPAPPAIPRARSRFGELLTALSLFRRGEYAIGALGWARHDGGAWRAVALGDGRRPRLLTLIGGRQADELQTFCGLLARRTPTSGEVAWALARFQMGCQRQSRFEALSDYLLALRALLEPEGPASGRLPGRLAALCAEPERRAALAARTARAVALERAVIGGLPTDAGESGKLIDELAEHLRALLRDIICGHLPLDVRSLADELIADSALALAA